MCTFRVMLAAALTAVLAVVGQGQGGCGPAPCDGDGGTATARMLGRYDYGETCGDANAACSELCWCGAECGKCGRRDMADLQLVLEKKDCLGTTHRCVSYIKRTQWFSEEWDQFYSGGGLAATGMWCKGRFCDQVALSMMSINADLDLQVYHGWISDNKGKKYSWNKKTDGLSEDCAEGHFVTGIKCRGRYCDDLQIRCAPPELEGWLVDTVGEAWQSGWFSEEGSSREERFGRVEECPVGFVMTGLECQENKQESGACVANCGHYCDNKRIRCRQIRPNVEAASTGIATAEQIAGAQAPSIPCNASCRAALYPEEDKTTPDKAITGAISGAVSPSSFCAFALAVLSLWL